MKKSIATLLFLLAKPLWCGGGTAYDVLLHQARHHMFNEDYALAREIALAARARKPQDMESYELVTLSEIFRLKKELGISGVNPISNTDKLQKHAAAVEQFKQDIDEGLRLAREQLMQNPGDERTLFLTGKLQLNKLMLILQVQNKKSGRTEYLEARRVMDGILLVHPGHCRALVASGWMNYIIGTRGFFERLGLTFLGLRGDRKKGVEEIAHAADALVACDPLDKIEARFSLLEILKKEQRWPQVYAIAKELESQFPENTQLKKYITFAAERTGFAK